MAIFAFVWIVVGLFIAAPPTRAILTIASVIGELATSAGLLIIGVGGRKSRPWRAWGRFSIIAGAVALVLVIATFKTSQPAIPPSERIEQRAVTESGFATIPQSP